MSGGNGCSLLSATPLPDLAGHGYTETEYAVGGIVAGVTPSGAAPPADFVTRMLVRRPAERSSFNGTLVVEWLNVSSGDDAAPEYNYLADELVRSGYAWAGVSAQYTGVEGGDGSVGLAGTGGPSGLAAKDPDRYSALSHPGDAYCYDIFAAIGAELSSPRRAGTDPRRAGTESDRAGTDPHRVGTAPHPLAGLDVQRTLAVGESQSAMALTSYVHRFADTHQVFDGYLIHSRSVAGLPLGEVGAPADITVAFTADPVRFDDAGAPVLVIQTETDVLTNFRYYAARQPDTDRLRVWEIAGTAHADLHQIGPFEEILGCPDPVNRGQQRFVLRAGLHHLNTWTQGTSAPPIAAPMLLDDAGTGEPAFTLDAVGNVVDGVRTPCVETPTQVLSGVVAEPISRICLLFGSTRDLTPGVLGERYGTPDQYLEYYESSTDAAIAAGFILAADRDQVLTDARPDLIPG